MAENDAGFRCRNCGKQIDIIHPTRWAYKVKRGAGYSYFCTWKCLREDEKKKNVKQAARKEETDNQGRNNRKEVLEKLMAAAEAGRDIYDYLRGMGYTDPKDTLRRLRITAKKEAPEIYRKMEKMGLLDLRKGNSGKGAGKMSQNKLTRAQKEKAVEIAIAGGDPLKHLAECGAKNPSAAWWYIKKTLAEKNPKLLEQIPEKPGTVLDENGLAVPAPEKQEGGPKVETAEKLPPEAVAEVSEIPVKFPTIEEKVITFRPPEDYGGLKIVRVRGEFGDYSIGGEANWFRFESTNRKTEITMPGKDMQPFVRELIKAAEVLGVEM